MADRVPMAIGSPELGAPIVARDALPWAATLCYGGGHSARRVPSPPGRLRVSPFPMPNPGGATPVRADVRPMKIRNSLKSLRGRHRDNQLVRRKGRVYVINKTQKRFKARQG